MSDERFRTYRERMFRLYAERRYAEALTHVEQGSSQFPERWAEIAYWRVCLAARGGNVHLALKTLSEASDRGWWWSEAALRRDPDLQTLQGLPDFERVVEISRKRHLAAQEASAPKLRVLQPQEGAAPFPILFALHGAGQNAEDFMEHWQAAASNGWLVAIPQSSQLVSPTRFGWTDLERATQEVLQHYDSVLKRHPVDPKRTVLAGFSQGGRTAIWLTLSGILPARGFLGVACALADLEEIKRLLRDREPKHRGYLIVGTKDYVYEQTLAMADLLRSYSIPIEVETIEGLAHEIPDDFDRRLARALQLLLS